MIIKILASAATDLVDGFNYYEEQEAGLGDYFLACLYSDIDGLRHFAGIHPKPYKKFHRCLSKRFPFGIFYTLDGETVLVRAVVDCRRAPSWIRRHLR